MASIVAYLMDGPTHWINGKYLALIKKSNNYHLKHNICILNIEEDSKLLLLFKYSLIHFQQTCFNYL